MTTTTISIHVPKPRTTPRLAQRIGEAAAAALTAYTQARRSARAAAEAARTREMAHAFDATDPRVAADLYAAADRHDLLNGNI